MATSLQSRLELFLEIAKTHALIAQLFDRGYLGGLTFNEFLVLYYLSQEKTDGLRRTDLAKKLGLTPSGITRITNPMEKIHLVLSEDSASDARSKIVRITTAGEEKIADSLDRISQRADAIFEQLQDMRGLIESLRAIRLRLLD